MMEGHALPSYHAMQILNIAHRKGTEVAGGRASPRLYPENSFARSSAHMNLNMNPGARCLRPDRSYFHPAWRPVRGMGIRVEIPFGYSPAASRI
jgi:hypothetical protein